MFVYRKKCTPFEVESEASRYSDRSISATPLDGSVNVTVSHQTANLNSTSKENIKKEVSELNGASYRLELLKASLSKEKISTFSSGG